MTKKRDVEILTNIKSLQNRQNLICRLAFFIQEQYQVESGVQVRLEKRIPVAAGLGGGSSNAAATISALSELWSLNLSQEEMHDIASKFGSDINFFLEGGMALGTGRGETIEPLPDLPEQEILLVNPRFDVSSAEAYKLYAVNAAAKDRSRLMREMRDYLVSGQLNNVLEPGIRKQYPIIDEIIVEMENSGIPAMLSGSGPTCIGYLDDSIDTRDVVRRFEEKGYWTCLTRTMKKCKAV